MMLWAFWRGCFVIGVLGRRIGMRSGGVERDGYDWEREGKTSALFDGLIDESRYINVLGTIQTV